MHRLALSTGRRLASTFTPRNPQFELPVRQAFESQTFMRTLGASVTSITPGEVVLEAPASADFLQHDGFFHAGVTVALADTAAGCAALSLFPAGSGVLSTEFKVNLLRPARATPGSSTLIARGRVLKAGHKLSVCASDAYTRGADGEEVHVATLLLTMIATDRS